MYLALRRDVRPAAESYEATQLANSHPWVTGGLRDVSEIYEWNVQQALGIGRFEPIQR
jgi:hypothetical protein